MTEDDTGPDAADRPEQSAAPRIVGGAPTSAEAAAALAVVNAALEEERREREQHRLNDTDDWNVSQRAIRAAGPFGGVTRRTLRPPG